MFVNKIIVAYNPSYNYGTFPKDAIMTLNANMFVFVSSNIRNAEFYCCIYISRNTKVISPTVHIAFINRATKIISDNNFAMTTQLYPILIH